MEVEEEGIARLGALALCAEIEGHCGIGLEGGWEGPGVGLGCREAIGRGQHKVGARLRVCLAPGSPDHSAHFVQLLDGKTTSGRCGRLALQVLEEVVVHLGVLALGLLAGGVVDGEEEEE